MVMESSYLVSASIYRYKAWLIQSLAGRMSKYEKVGWREVGVTDVELKRWGWQGEKESSRTVSMFRGIGG
jgi:hypothetical protein